MSTRFARPGLAVLLVALLGLVSAAGPAGGQTGSPVPDDEGPPRLLVISIPTLLWSDVTPGRIPNLRGFLEEAAVAGLATRVTTRTTETGEAYATIGAANRAVASADLAARALDPDERYGFGTAADEFLRHTGEPLEGAAGLLTIGGLQTANDRAAFGAQVGRVGTLLLAEGFTPAVIANADRPRPLDAQPLASTAGPPGVDLHREAVAAFMDHRGLVVGGRVDRGLRREDPDAAFGTRLDPDAVLAAVDDALTAPQPVVLVELSDPLLAEAGRRAATDEAAQVLDDRALTWTDELVGELLARMDDPGDVVMVLAPTPDRSPHLTVLGLRDPTRGTGLLQSAQTRQAGYVTITDVGPTILDVLGLPQPRGVEGRPAVVGERGGTGAARIDHLVAADEAARARDEIVPPVTNVYVVAAVLFVVAATASFSVARLAPWARLFGLWLVATLPITYLAGPLGVAEWGAAGYLAVVAAGGLVLGAVAVGMAGLGALARLRPLGALALVFSVDMAVVGVSVVLLDSALQLSTVFGDSPIVAGRFSGVNNITFAQLVVAAIVLAALIVRTDRLRWPAAAEGDGAGAGRSRRRPLAAATLLLVAVMLVDGLPMWGADVGGVLAALPAFAVTWLALAERRIRLRDVVLWGVATVLAVVVLGLVDLSRPSADRSHLGRLFERIADDGVEGLWLVVDRKIDQNLRTITGQPWTWLLVVTALALGWLLWRHRQRLLDAFAPEPELRAAALGLGVALVLGFALNDSGVAVPGMMLVTALPVGLWLVLPPGAQDPSAPATPVARAAVAPGAAADDRAPAAAAPVGAVRPVAEG